MTDLKKDTLYIPLEGVESEHCALIVTKAMKEVKGLENSKVELNNHRAVLTNANQDQVNEVVAKIRTREVFPKSTSFA